MAKKPAPHNKGTVIGNARNRAANAGYTSSSQYTSHLNPNRPQAVKWFKDNLRKTVVDPSRLIREEQANLVNSWRNLGIGKMYSYFYDPKHKKKLPYYDRFPLMIPIHMYPDGFLGLNLHYLAPRERLKLFNALLDVQNNAHYNDRKRMVVTYGILKNAADTFSGYRPCVKRYLGKHVRSRFIRFDYSDWSIAAFLPTETFEKASKSKVWADSRKMK